MTAGKSYIPKVCLAYNTYTHPTTGETPFCLMYGCHAHLPMDLMYGTKSTGTSVSKELGCQCPWHLNRLEKEQDACNNSRGNCRTSTFTFEAGELVWLHNPAVRREECKKVSLSLVRSI